MRKPILQLIALALLALSPAIALAGEENVHPADAAASGSGRYVVTLKVESSEAGAVSEELIRKLGVRRLPLNAQNFAGFAIVATPAVARELSADPRVESVEEQTFTLGAGATVPAAASQAPFPSHPVIPESRQRAASIRGGGFPAAVSLVQPAASGSSIEPAGHLASSPAGPTVGKASTGIASAGHGRAAAETVLPCNPCSYSYDALGNILSIGPDVYQYDVLNRLKTATVAGGAHSQSFTYDLNGNMQTVTTDGTTNTLSPDAQTNRLPTSLATYDGAGNMLTYGGSANTYAWDAVNMMTHRTAPGVDEQYVYDASDERIAIIAGTATRYTLRGAGPQILREVVDTPGTNSHSLVWSRDYVYRDGALLAELNPTYGTVHFHLDHLGSTRLMTDMSAKQLAAYNYYPFGGQVDPPDDQRVRFTGHELDLGGGGQDLYYMHARDQIPAAGRLLTIDPILDLKKTLPNPQMWNRYAYVVNNPLRYTDPDGREHVNEPGFTKPLSEANDWAEHPEVSWAFYSEGALLTLAAGGPLRNAAVEASLALMRNPGAVLAAMKVLDAFGGDPVAHINPTGLTGGKLGYLLGKVESVESRGKGGFFAGVMGFNAKTLDAAIRSHFAENFAKGEIQANGRLAVTGTMTGANGVVRTVQTVWQWVAKNKTWDLVTGFPAK